ncbi:hypothetical protein [Halorussus lipolyticus]|uniref:hypothetical protein n=1 Tax=Halorussus lipolyticus TaxID=3034024 RepID=UPI0023E81E86|nr:hypothetical protein [Halorussus sp. DT80]
MTDPRDEVVTQLEKHEETLRLHEFVRLVEIHHRDEGPGVERELLEAYADAVSFDVDSSAIDDRLTDSERWELGHRLYELDSERISNYPPDWHDRLVGTDDVREIIEVIQSEVTEPEGDEREAVTDERGVPQPKVVRVGQAIADIDPDTTRERINQMRDDDDVEEFATQHRDPTIRLE